MPTYEYECLKCPRVFEVKQRISEPALSTCDLCGGPIQRLLSATPFILKGGGWYVTDYPSESRKKAVSSESGEKASSPSSDAKPATGESQSSPASGTASEGSAKPSPAKPSSGQD